MPEKKIQPFLASATYWGDNVLPKGSSMPNGASIFINSWRIFYHDSGSLKDVECLTRKTPKELRWGVKKKKKRLPLLVVHGMTSN